MKFKKKMSITKIVPLKSYSSMKIFFRKFRIIFALENWLKVRILPFLTTFTQLTKRLNNFLRGWLLILDLKEGLVECATVCIKSEVILMVYVVNVKCMKLTYISLFVICKPYFQSYAFWISSSISNFLTPSVISLYVLSF